MFGQDTKEGRIMSKQTVTTFTGCNLQEALDGFNVSRLEARREIERHNLNFGDFIYEMEQVNQYSRYAKCYMSSDILEWLGY